MQFGQYAEKETQGDKDRRKIVERDESIKARAGQRGWMKYPARRGWMTNPAPWKILDAGIKQFVNSMAAHVPGYALWKQGKGVKEGKSPISFIVPTKREKEKKPLSIQGLGGSTLRGISTGFKDSW